MINETPIAHPVTSSEQVIQVQVPAGHGPGDTFICYPGGNGRPFTVIVPDGAMGGAYLEVIVPDAAEVDKKTSSAAGASAEQNENDFLRIRKSTLAAGVAGGLVGAVLLGPIGAVVIGGASAYATTRQSGKIGETARKVGDFTYDKAATAKNWTETKLRTVVTTCKGATTSATAARSTNSNAAGAQQQPQGATL